MEQNNFEKTVQQKMDELKIPPSDLVWTNIEKKISKKKKNKRWYHFIFLFLPVDSFAQDTGLLAQVKNDSNRTNL